MRRRRWGALAIAVVVAISLFSLIPPRTPPISAAGTSWTQDLHDAQRTGATSDEPAEPWTYLWSFNGPDSSGGSSGHFFEAPIEARPVAGGGLLYVPAGSKGLYALKEATGAIVWHDTSASYNAAPAYDPTTGELLAGGSDGVLRAFNAQTGALVGTFSTGNPLNKAVLIAGNAAYVVTDDGHLFKVLINGLSPAWAVPYAGGARAATSPAYSASRDVIIYCTDQASGATCHAVNNADGSRKWSVQPFPSSLKPTTYPGSQYTYNTPDHSWPAIAERHGVVFVWLNLYDIGETTMAQHPPSSGNYFPAGAVNGPSGTNAQVRSWLQSNPQYQSVYALSLDTGAPVFVPAIGFAGAEWLPQGAPVPTHSFAGAPVIKTWSNGDEVAYTTFRNGSCAALGGADYRWDSQVGEMTLDGTTVPGLNAGDLRFVGWAGYGACGYRNAGTTYAYITDEKSIITMAGSTLFFAHWGASDAAALTNRASSLGMTISSPLTVTTHPSVMRGVQPCGTMNPTTHYTTQSFCSLFGDTRGWNGPLFWTYWNTSGPLSSYPDGPTLPYTFVSDGYLIVQGNDGDLMVFATSAAPQPTPTPVLPYSVFLAPIYK